MTKEQLLAAGYTEEQAATILDIYKKSIDGQYVPKHRFDEVNAELKVTKEQLTERDAQINDLKQTNGDAKALNDKIEELKAYNEQKDNEYKNNLALERKKNATRLALLEDPQGKPYDVDMVMGLFDLNKIIVDETTGKLKEGFKEQNDVIRKEKTFLFEPKPDPSNPNGWKPKSLNPKDGDPGSNPNTSEAYGKSLAAVKLGMMGVKPVNPTE